MALAGFSLTIDGGRKMKRVLLAMVMGIIFFYFPIKIRLG